MKQKREREEPCPTCNHYHDVRVLLTIPTHSDSDTSIHYHTYHTCSFTQVANGEVCSVCGHRAPLPTDNLPVMSALPTPIVEGFLYVGSYDNASRDQIMQMVGITHILNVCCEHATMDGDATMLVVWCRSSSSSSSSSWFVVITCLTQLITSPNTSPTHPPTHHDPLSHQCVPSCQVLFKNSFEYHTVSATPPPLQECFEFIGTCQCCSVCAVWGL